ncbi:TetR/AcrR family transcriptional regulator [Nocardiopsis sp. N85]|uniref:TetR/AcrR family transcriptional regulator n=1 Tax=Nocardiopsis sp. N85 TaxID=3029400 RepID=UPI00237FA505|nr:TetR/AcrR family transcriptional regulator [Nocardiopsis sp. N85]MDE3720793.1 TetR/AcrR family transcriptional regulator [Nocardiopsis sp. N85]
MSTTSPDPLGAVSGDDRPGLREFKKARTRRTLIETGLRLFHEQGFERTTTEEIASRAGVSQRTLFRYFATKEDLVLEALESVDLLLIEHLLARPADEPPFRALCNAMRDHWEYVERESMHHIKGSAAELITQSPELIRTNVNYCRRRQARLTEAIAERTGADPVDPRPALVAAVFFAALNNGHGEWELSGSTDVEGLLRCFLRHLDLVPEALGDGWGTPAPDRRAER